MYILLILALSSTCLIAQSKYLLVTDSVILVNSHKVLIQQIGVTEKQPNWGEPISSYLRSVGINSPAPYCNAGQYYCFAKVTSNVPMVKSGLAISSYQKALKQGLKAPYVPQVNDLIVWNKTNTIFGHIERIIEVGKAGWCYTVGFNTTSGIRGNQRDGGGVYRRRRNIYHPLGRNAIRGLIGWKTKH